MDQASETPTEKTKPLTLTLDAEKYLGQLAGLDISDEQKREYIIALWNLLRSFAELGFEVHPVQLAVAAERKPPAQNTGGIKKDDISSADVLCLTALSRTEREFLVEVFHGASGRDYDEE